MKRNSNYRVETVNVPEDLLKFEGWEIQTQGNGAN